MSVGLYKYDGNIFEDAKEVLSENVASQRMYDKYLQPAIKELSIFYFQDGSEIKKANLDLVMDEIGLLIKWVASHVEVTQGVQDLLLEILRDLGTISEGLEATIVEQTDRDVLNEWVKIAVKCTKIEEFEEGLRGDL